MSFGLGSVDFSSDGSHGNDCPFAEWVNQDGYVFVFRGIRGGSVVQVDTRVADQHGSDRQIENCGPKCLESRHGKQKKQREE
jgi:hypothetical protein